MIAQLVERLADHLLTKGETLVTAESCTGGMVSAALTSISGSSAWFDRAYITYSNEAKTQMLGVQQEVIQEYGAVSEEVVLAMHGGALTRSGASYAIAITGIAGPEGGTKSKPVGTVWIAVGSASSVRSKRFGFLGNRDQVRTQAVEKALSFLLDRE